MTKEKAFATAQARANRQKKEYVAIRSRNGQWMVERAAFLNTAEGRLCYPVERQREAFLPTR